MIVTQKMDASQEVQIRNFTQYLATRVLILRNEADALGENSDVIIDLMDEITEYVRSKTPSGIIRVAREDRMEVTALLNTYPDKIYAIMRKAFGEYVIPLTALAVDEEGHPVEDCVALTSAAVAALLFTTDASNGAVVKWKSPGDKRFVTSVRNQVRTEKGRALVAGAVGEIGGAVAFPVQEDQGQLL